MDFKIDAKTLLNFDNDGIAILNCSQIKKNTKQFSGTNIISRQNDKHNVQKLPLENIIDTLGQLSAKAQGLKSTITTYEKIQSTDNKIYFKMSENCFQGFIKIGHKNLFYNDVKGKIYEMQPLCVLDFYVHESCQRGGIGGQLFERMLQDNNINPYMLAYDKPSPKLISFMRKHYNLCKYVPQNNLYVIYDEYFNNNKCNQMKKTQEKFQENNRSQTENQFNKQCMKKTQEKFQENNKHPVLKQKEQQNAQNDDVLIKSKSITQHTNKPVQYTNQQTPMKPQSLLQQQTPQQLKTPIKSQTTLKSPWALQEKCNQYETTSNNYGKVLKTKENR